MMTRYDFIQNGLFYTALILNIVHQVKLTDIYNKKLQDQNMNVRYCDNLIHSHYYTRRPAHKNPNFFLFSSLDKRIAAICCRAKYLNGLVGFGFNGPLRQYLCLHRAVSQREGEGGEKK